MDYDFNNKNLPNYTQYHKRSPNETLGTCEIENQLQQFIDKYKLLESEDPDKEYVDKEELDQRIATIVQQNERVQTHIIVFKWFNLLELYDSKHKTVKLYYYANVKDLDTNDMFGELALNNNQRRAGRVVCTEDSVFCTLQKKDYRHAMEATIRK